MRKKTRGHGPTAHRVRVNREPYLGTRCRAYTTSGAIAAAAPADMPVYNKVSVPQARSSAAKNGTVHAARAAVVICDSSGRLLGTRRGCGSVDENS
ncbi:hypothetical protein MTO96_003699 [Rhipicephalus appendiculatus]